MNNRTINTDPLPYLKEVIENTLNKKIIQWKRPECGLSSAIRYSLELEDKSNVFVKAAVDSRTEEWLKTEHRALASHKEDCMPAMVDWIDEPGNYPVLLTQDFSDAYWAAGDKGVYWRNGDIDVLLDAVKKLSTVKGHHSLVKLENYNAEIWTKIAGNPDEFLQLKTCSKNWLKYAIDHLIEAEHKVNNTGEILVHGDIRSDNICIDNSRVIFVDWSNARVGCPDHDLANLLPALHLEGGPAPFQLMPGASPQAAHICATHIQRLSKDKSMPFWLTTVFKKLIAIELEWAAQCLNLDQPDGIKWNQMN